MGSLSRSQIERKYQHNLRFAGVWLGLVVFVGFGALTLFASGRGMSTGGSFLMGLLTLAFCYLFLNSLLWVATHDGRKLHRNETNESLRAGAER